MCAIYVHTRDTRVKANALYGRWAVCNACSCGCVTALCFHAAACPDATMQRMTSIRSERTSSQHQTPARSKQPAGRRKLGLASTEALILLP